VIEEDEEEQGEVERFVGRIKDFDYGYGRDWIYAIGDYHIYLVDLENNEMFLKVDKGPMKVKSRDLTTLLAIKTIEGKVENETVYTQF
jgi:hypothetical protein